ncbi:hypothetical protein [Spirosoma spitsbergense]|uniref:hypothetical protein n=1 Tax=Spirosoma spitsbergense TaxID=431554 RepID=UPI00039F3F27
MPNPETEPNILNRREFMTCAGASVVALGTAGLPPAAAEPTRPGKAPVPIRIENVNANFEREPLNPYRFKGSAITDSWQTVARLDSASGRHAVGLGTQGVLWSDSRVFAAHSESAGNALMYAMSERALQLLKGTSFTNPIELIDSLLPEVLAYGKQITGNPDLRKTFALNALVCVDNAAWLLYAQENNITRFDDMIPDTYKPGLSYRHDKVASIPSFSVGTTAETVKAAADEGYFILKLKTGSAGTQPEMIEKDIAFLTAVHRAIGQYETPYTPLYEERQNTVLLRCQWAV